MSLLLQAAWLRRTLARHHHHQGELSGTEHCEVNFNILQNKVLHAWHIEGIYITYKGSPHNLNNGIQHRALLAPEDKELTGFQIPRHRIGIQF